MENVELYIEQLEKYLDDFEPISPHNIKRAMQLLSEKHSERNTRVFLKIVKLINTRIDEVVNFTCIICNNEYTEEEKEKLAFETLPFKEGNVDVENRIIAIEYGEKESESYEDLIVGFLGEVRLEFENKEEQVKEFIHKHNLTFETIKEIEEENKKSHSKTRSN